MSGLVDAISGGLLILNRGIHLGIKFLVACKDTSRDPVPALRLVEVRSGDNVVEHAAVFFDRSDRTDVVVVTRY